MAERVNRVTGAMGFSGSYVVRELLAAGERVVGTDRAEVIGDERQLAILERLGVAPDHPHLEWIAADLLEPESLEPLFARRPARVFHTASLYDYSAPLDRLRRINV